MNDGVNGTNLVLRCREIHDVAQHASELLRLELKTIGDAGRIYAFKHRLKPAGAILEKVQRKRAEAAKLSRKNSDLLASTDHERDEERQELYRRITELKGYGPDHVTDAWGCRFVTLFQDQIPILVRAILSRLETFNTRSTAKVTLREFVIYTSQLPTNPLSIVAPTLTVLRESGLASSVVIDEKAIRKPENKKSAYSSVHMIFCIPLIVDHPGRGNTNEVASIEVQVRDIFEEGWGEIEHFLVYSDRAAKNAGDDDENERPWQGFLNVLKTNVDGCSSNASMINRTAQAEGRTKMPSLSQKSTTHRDVDRSAIMATLHGKVPAEVATLIRQAYDNLIAGESAETKDDAIANFAAAAGFFEQAMVGLGSGADLPVLDRDNRAVRYFLEMELANCYLYGAMVHKLDDAIKIYSGVIEKFPRDPVARVRLAKAIVEKNPTRETFLKSIDALRAALDLISSDPLTGPGHWVQMSTLIQMGWDYWKLAEEYKKAGNNDAQKEQLRNAIKTTREAYQYWSSLDKDDAGGVTHRLLAHKALSNILYYAAKLRDLVPPEDPDCSSDAIRKWIGELSAIVVPGYRDYYRTQDNMMHAYDSIGERDAAVNLANEIYDYLKKTAERRAGRVLKFDEIANYLDAEERNPFMAAVGTKLGRID